MIGRRRFVSALACVFAGRVSAQPARTPIKIGFLRIVAPPRIYIDALEQGLRDRGFEPGRDIVIDYRFADGRDDDLDRLARELVERKVAIIVAAGNQAVRAARKATTSIPIVMAVANEPVATGAVASLARPGGNVTGVTLMSSTLTGKRLEILKEVMPRLSRVAVLINKDNPANAITLKETRATAAALRIEVFPFEVQGAASFDKAFAAMANAHVEALVLFEDALFISERARLADLASRTKLPAVFGQRNSVDDGGLMSYGPSITDGYQKAGYFIDRILKGAKPGDLPVEQPTKFEMVVNLKAAKSLGLTIPQAVLVRADEVIQ